MENPLKWFDEFKLIAVIRTSSAENAEEMIKAARAGGFRLFEVSVQNPYAYRVLETYSKDKEIRIGANMVTDGEIAQRAINAGAHFISTPFTDDEIISVAKHNNNFVIQGAATPSEAVFAYQAGADLVKVYPAALCGGVAFVRAIRNAVPFVKLIAAGGIKVDDVVDYVKYCSAVCLGYNLFTKPLVRASNWTEITARAMAFNQKISLAKQDSPENGKPLLQNISK